MCTVTFMIPLAVSMAGSVRVGTSLGANKPEQARFSAYVAFFICVVVMSVFAILMLILRYYVAYIFTSNEEIISQVAFVMFCGALFQVFDGAFTCASGILRGLGKQYVGALLNLIGFYLIGLPLQWFLAFYLQWQLYGIWSALSIALAVAAVLCASFVFCFTNWELQARKAQERVKK